MSVEGVYLVLSLMALLTYLSVANTHYSHCISSTGCFQDHLALCHSISSTDQLIDLLKTFPSEIPLQQLQLFQHFPLFFCSMARRDWPVSCGFVLESLLSICFILDSSSETFSPGYLSFGGSLCCQEM